MDLKYKPISLILRQSPPLNYLSQPHWFNFTYDQNVVLAASGNFTLTSLTYSLNAAANAVTLSTNFDQYCIYWVKTRMFIDSNVGVSTNVAATAGRIGTAIDFDNAGTIGSFLDLQSYATFEEAPLRFGNSYERELKPCVTPSVYNGSASFSGYAVGRTWLDCANPGIPHYGLRVGTLGNPTVTSLNIVAVTTMVLGFRNSI